jgi:hypothetical protein
MESGLVGVISKLPNHLLSLNFSPRRYYPSDLCIIQLYMTCDFMLVSRHLKPPPEYATPTPTSGSDSWLRLLSYHSILTVN